jgi:hypothetical protein
MHGSRELPDAGPAEPPSNAPRRVFPPERDVLDSLEFYASILGVFVACGWFLVEVAAIRGILGRRSSNDSRAMVRPTPIFVMALVVQGVVAGTIAGFMTWRRFAERFELTETELMWRLGFATIHFPLTRIDRLHPMGIVRVTTSVKRGIRVWFSECPTREIHCRNRVSKWIAEKLPPHLIRRTPMNNPQMYCDIAPRDIEGFLREVEARRAVCKGNSNSSERSDRPKDS